MPEISLYDRDMNLKPYDTGNGVRLYSEDGTAHDFISASPVETTVQPDFSEGDMEVSPGEDELFSKVTIVKPPNLTAGNISKGITIAGVKGELEAGSMSDKPIRFYDPYGNVIYGYTRAEIQEMTELPPGPALSGLTFDQWTHTIDELKAVTYFADVGPMYKSGTKSVAVIIIETIMTNKAIYLYFYSGSSSDKTVISWGDGSTTTMSGSSSGTVSANHTYATTGKKIITIDTSNAAGSLKIGHSRSSQYYGLCGGQITSSSLSSTVENWDLISFLSGSKVTMFGGSFTGIDYLPCNQRLRFVSVYKANNEYGSSKRFIYNPSLKVIAGNVPYKSAGTYQHYGNTSIERLSLGGSIGANALDLCDSLKEIMFGSGTINDANMNSKWAMLMTSETPPTIGASSPVWGTYPIYVPDSAVDAYKAASGWSNVAAYIFPASEYPDK